MWDVQSSSALAWEHATSFLIGLWHFMTLLPVVLLNVHRLSCIIISTSHQWSSDSLYYDCLHTHFLTAKFSSWTLQIVFFILRQTDPLGLSNEYPSLTRQSLPIFLRIGEHDDGHGIVVATTRQLRWESTVCWFFHWLGRHILYGSE